jgi:hypothetical protein
MKNYKISIPFIFLTLFLSACQVVGGIFKAGMGVGIFIVLAVIAVIVFIVMRARK